MQTVSSSQAGLTLACAEAEVPTDGTVITRTVGDRSIALARRSPGEQEVVAFAARCPHMLGPFRFGRVVDGEAVCPWHFMRFDTATGQTVGCPDSVMRLETYVVECRDGQVYVGDTRPFC